MQFELTHSVNVPAEREKLRQLRNEIAADVAHRNAINRKYSPRGFPLLPDMHPLEAKGKPRNGETPPSPVRTWAGMGVSATASDMRETQASSRGRGKSAGGMECEGVTQ